MTISDKMSINITQLTLLLRFMLGVYRITGPSRYKIAGTVIYWGKCRDQGNKKIFQMQTIFLL